MNLCKHLQQKQKPWWIPYLLQLKLSIIVETYWQWRELLSCHHQEDLISLRCLPESKGGMCNTWWINYGEDGVRNFWESSASNKSKNGTQLPETLRLKIYSKLIIHVMIGLQYVLWQQKPTKVSNWTLATGNLAKRFGDQF